MIFVTVGTGKFDELIIEIDKIAPKIKEKIIAQIGSGSYLPKNIEFFRFKVPLDLYYKKASLIISHGGAGTIYALLKQNKKVIGIANQKRTDAHQQEILEALSEESYLIWCRNINELENCIVLARSFKFKKYNQPECRIANKIIEFLNKK